MSKKKVVGIIASSIVAGTAVVTWIMKKKERKKPLIKLKA